MFKMEDNFKKAHIVKDLTISSIVLLAGIALVFVNMGLGIFVAVCGLLMFLFYKKGYRKEGRDATLSMVTKDIGKSGSSALLRFLDGEDCKFEIKEGNDGGTIHMVAYYNKENSIAYVQLFHYVSYISEPMTGVVELTGGRADALFSKL